MLLDLLDLLDLLLKSQRAEGAFSQGSPVCFAGFWPSIPETQWPNSPKSCSNGQRRHQNVSLWLKYLEMEMKNKFVNHARNLFDRAKPSRLDNDISEQKKQTPLHNCDVVDATVL